MTSDDVMTCFSFNPLVNNTFRLNSLRSFLCVIQYFIQYFCVSTIAFSTCACGAFVFSAIVFRLLHLFLCLLPYRNQRYHCIQFWFEQRESLSSHADYALISPHEMVFS